MTLRVIGAGLGRTGTLSLKVALETLGVGRCYHMSELITEPERVVHWNAASRGKPVDWEALFQGYGAAVDYPTCLYWHQLIERYPEARVILTVRDPERWYESALGTIHDARPGLREIFRMIPKTSPSWRLWRLLRVFRMIERDVWKGHFGGRFHDREHALAVFEAHRRAVQTTVAPERLLVYRVSEGWGPLCRFLGVAEPVMAFPRRNDREEFQRSVRALLDSL